MNSVANSDFGPPGSSLLKVRADAGELNCHVSPVIYRIRDHGPAVIDGEFYKELNKDNAAALPAAAKIPAAAAPGAVEPAVPQLPGRGVYKAMMFLIVLLVVALASVGFYAWQQKVHVNDLQAELKIYDDPDKDN